MDQIHQTTTKIRYVFALAAGACALAWAASTMASFAADTSPDVNASCRIPFEKLKDPKTGESFPLSVVLNENAKLSENLRQRYIVADLNSADGNGNCRGVQIGRAHV